MSITLKAARINVGLTQKESAERLGISKETLSKYERGISFPDVIVIRKMEELYDVSYSDIIFLTNKNAKSVTLKT